MTTKIKDDHFCDNSMCNQHHIEYNGNDTMNIMHDDQIIRIERYEFRNSANNNTTRNFFCSICINVINTINEAKHSLYTTN